MFEQLISHYDELERFIQRRVRCVEEAADLTQETYRRVIASYGQAIIAQPRPLLFRVARNLIIDRSRRQQNHLAQQCQMTSDPISDQVCPGVIAEQRERLTLVRVAISHLPSRCREVFILHRFGGMTYRQIADHLDISSKTVEKHIARAIVVCKNAIEQTEGTG